MSHVPPFAARVEVLLIDDSEIDGMLFRRAVEHDPGHEFGVTQACTLALGLEALTQSSPDCVVLDLGLPDSSGLEGLRQVLALDRAPVIVMTGSGSERIAVEALQLGAQDYLVKELTASPRTAHAVRYAIERRRAQHAVVAAERQFAAAQREFELELAERHKLEALSVLAGGIAADFNNLAGVILGNATLVLGMLPPGGDEHAAVDDIRRAALRSADLTRQMLAYCGEGRYEVERVPLAEIVRGLVEPARESISIHATLELHLEPETPEVEGDVRQLDQLLLNLMTNAAEAIGGEPGAIRIGTRAVVMDRAGLAAYPWGDELPEGRYAELLVADTGGGIPAESLGKIFDPFFTTRVEGRGLGLAAVHGIVRGHGGAIRVESDHGRGSDFRVLLPAAAPDVAAAVAVPAGVSSPA